MPSPAIFLHNHGVHVGPTPSPPISSWPSPCTCTSAPLHPGHIWGPVITHPAFEILNSHISLSDHSHQLFYLVHFLNHLNRVITPIETSIPLPLHFSQSISVPLPSHPSSCSLDLMHVVQCLPSAPCLLTFRGASLHTPSPASPTLHLHCLSAWMVNITGRNSTIRRIYIMMTHDLQPPWLLNDSWPCSFMFLVSSLSRTL